MHLSYAQTHEGTQGHEDHTFATGLLGSPAHLCNFILPMLHYAQYGALSGDTLTSRRLQGQAMCSKLLAWTYQLFQPVQSLENCTFTVPFVFQLNF